MLLVRADFVILTVFLLFAIGNFDNVFAAVDEESSSQNIENSHEDNINKRKFLSNNENINLSEPLNIYPAERISSTTPTLKTINNGKKRIRKLKRRQRKHKHLLDPGRKSNYSEETVRKEGRRKNKRLLNRLEFSNSDFSLNNSSENMLRIDQMAKSAKKKKKWRRKNGNRTSEAETRREMEVFLNEITNSTTEFLASASTSNPGQIFGNQTNSKIPKKQRKRKMRRKHHKKLNKESRKRLQGSLTTSESNILEVTTARTNKLLTEIRSNSSINDLIQKLNANPEGNFINFGEGVFNKTDLQVAPSSRNNGSSNDLISLHISVDGNSTRNFRKPNRCSRNRGGCSQVCRARGKRKCACLEGFILASDMKTCLDIDECVINNGGCEQECRNILGSFECLCKPGLRLASNLKNCEDVNECILRNGHGPCQGRCTNLFGSYQCSCENLNGTQLSSDKHNCEDIDECQVENGGCSHECINTLGSSFCACPPGLELSSDWKTCQDINECEDEAIRSSCKSGCINTDGSYKCLDLTEYQNDEGYNGLDQIACKPLFPPKLGGFVNCSREGAYRSFGKTGRVRIKNSPGTTCELVCKVGYRIMDQYHVICGFDGKWQGKTSGKCVPAPYPTLTCPEDQFFQIDDDSDTALVKFPSPRSNVNWKYIKSQPKWAKNLIGYLKEGKHTMYFRVKDPYSQLISTCSFKVSVEKKVPNN